jgi:hypothetical protein
VLARFVFVFGRAMGRRVQLAGFLGVMGRVRGVAGGGLRVVGRLLVVAGVVMLGRVTVVGGGVLVMFGRHGVVFAG